MCDFSLNQDFTLHSYVTSLLNDSVGLVTEVKAAAEALGLGGRQCTLQHLYAFGSVEAQVLCEAYFIVS